MYSRLNSLRAKCIGHRFRTGVFFCLALGLATIPFAESKSIEVKQVTISAEGYSCPIQISDPYGGRLDEDGYELKDLPNKKIGLEGLSLYLVCFSVNDTKHIRYSVAATYDKGKGRWKKDVSFVPRGERPTTKVFPLRGVNSSGVGMTREATTDDPRSFAFCMRHPPVVLCGGLPASGRLYAHRDDWMPYALSIINSIQFVGATAVGISTDRPIPVRR